MLKYCPMSHLPLSVSKLLFSVILNTSLSLFSKTSLTFWPGVGFISHLHTQPIHTLAASKNYSLGPKFKKLFEKLLVSNCLMGGILLFIKPSDEIKEFISLRQLSCSFIALGTSFLTFGYLSTDVPLKHICLRGIWCTFLLVGEERSDTPEDLYAKDWWVGWWKTLQWWKKNTEKSISKWWCLEVWDRD